MARKAARRVAACVWSRHRARLGAAGVATAAAWGWEGAIDRLERFVRAQDPGPVAEEGTLYHYAEEIVRLRTAHARWRTRYEKS